MSQKRPARGSSQSPRSGPVRRRWEIEKCDLIPASVTEAKKKRLVAELGKLVYSALEFSQLSDQEKSIASESTSSIENEPKG